MELDNQIEAILFWRGEPSAPELCRALKLPRPTSRRVAKPEEKLQGRSRAHSNRGRIRAATAPETHELIERLRKEELAKDLGKAALETLSVVLYKEKVSRRDIEYIRGVNSTTILRSLLMRGLVERRQSEKDERVFLYRPTIDLLSLLGITSAEELPEFQDVRTELAAAETAATVAGAALADGAGDGEDSVPSGLVPEHE